MDYKKEALNLHRKYHGKISVKVDIPLKEKKDLCWAYTPGVAAVSLEIAKNKEKIWDYTIKSHSIAVVSDGSAVLGLGNIGPEAALPVIEGKALLFKALGGIDAFPICLNTQNPDEIIRIIKAIAPVFGGINLEDISAPRCFEIEDALQNIGIPVIHDDQHGTAIVVLAGLINAAKVVGKKMSDLKVVISGAGAAGQAIAKLITHRISDVIIVDSKGIIYEGRAGLDKYKQKWARVTNKEKRKGALIDAIKGMDVFIGVSRGNLINQAEVKTMAEKPIIFALANPNPEILPDEAKAGGAYVVATGRSDYPNQINNALAFPGILKGALNIRATKITDQMKIAAAKGLAGLIKNPTQDKIIPACLDKKVAAVVANAVITSYNYGKK